jgi:hypothetical protein
MNTQTVNASAISPVLVSDIVPVTPLVMATQEQVNAFADAIRNGAPTGKILPASITDLKAAGGITVAQLAQIKAARKEHGSLCVGNRKMLFTLAKSRELKAARFNKNAKLIAFRFGDKPAKVKASVAVEFPLASK